MKRVLGWKIFFMVALLAGAGAHLAAAEETPKEDEAALSKLLEAVTTSDYAAFVADGEAPFQKLKKEQFAAVAAMVAPRLQAGYEVVFLGQLKQQGYRVTLWKLSFGDAGDDVLATLSMKDGMIGGFFLR